MTQNLTDTEKYELATENVRLKEDIITNIKVWAGVCTLLLVIDYMYTNGTWALYTTIIWGVAMGIATLKSALKIKNNRAGNINTRTEKIQAELAKFD